MKFILAHKKCKTSKAFKSQNVEKMSNFFDLIGRSQSFLKKWILFQIYGDMTQEHYGSAWAIDHC